jgi:DNA polymerase/3'-5' exonuclease PolX
MKVRRPTAELLPIAQTIAGMLKDACEQLSIAGSIRRNRATAEDIELVVVPKMTNGEHELWALLDEMLLNGDIEKALYGKKQRTKWVRSLAD